MSRAAKNLYLFYLFGLTCFLDFMLTLALIDVELNPLVKFLNEVYGPMIFALLYYWVIVYVILVGLIVSKLRILNRIYYYCLVFLLIFKMFAVLINIVNLLSSIYVQISSYHEISSIHHQLVEKTSLRVREFDFGNLASNVIFYRLLNYVNCLHEFNSLYCLSVVN